MRGARLSVAVLALVTGLVTPAGAQEPAGGSPPPQPLPRRSATTGQEESGGILRSPTGLAVRSLLIPGWGQATNGDWGKMAIAVGLEGYLIYSIVRDSQKLQDLDPNDPEYAKIDDRRTGSYWWLGGVVFLSMVDAYVSAHLKGVEARIEPEPTTDGAAVKVSVRF